MKNLIIFGTGDIAQIAKFYFARSERYRPVAFTVDAQFLKEEQFEGLPVIGFEEARRVFPPSESEMFVALSYSQMNALRAKKYSQAKESGYKLASYLSDKCTYLSQSPPGDNTFIFEDNTIQPYVEIGSNVTIWSGNHIGHHSKIQDHTFISSHVVISGHCTISSFSFLGVNSTLAHNVVIAPRTLVGAGAVIAKSTEESGVYVAPRCVKLDKKSDQFKL